MSPKSEMPNSIERSEYVQVNVLLPFAVKALAKRHADMLGLTMNQYVEKTLTKLASESVNEIEAQMAVDQQQLDDEHSLIRKFLSHIETPVS